jgi:hypothetical protein
LRETRTYSARLTSLGHDAQSVDFDRRFVDAARDLAPNVMFNAYNLDV